MRKTLGNLGSVTIALFLAGACSETSSDGQGEHDSNTYDTSSDTWSGWHDVTSDAVYDTYADTSYDSSYDTGVDAVSDAASDPGVDPVADSPADTMPDLPPDTLEDVPTDTVEDDPIEEPPDVCDPTITEPQVLYLSADDSNSQASPIIARSIIESGALVPSSLVRTYEFTNYYDISYTPAAHGRVNVVTQMKPHDTGDGWGLQIGAQAHALAPADARPLNVTLVLDTSGSMSGSPITLERRVCRAIGSSLRSGDIISMVTWTTSHAVELDSHVVSGPHDTVVRYHCDSIIAGGGTDLNGGLTAGYELATDNYDSSYLNRVVLISDGQANAGITDEAIIAGAAEDEETEGIYLVGVGVGTGYNDTLMDTVTDAGKGAYVFIDSAAEADKMFGDRFLSTMEIAVRDVQLELTLPPWLRIEVFYGEEISTSPKEVEPQHLAPNDAMIFHQDVIACSDPVLTDEVVAVAAFTDPVTRARLQDSVTFTVAELLDSQDDPQLIKGMAIVQYAEGLKEVGDLVMYGSSSMAQSACDDLRDDIGEASTLTGDAELDEIHDLLVDYCSSLSWRSPSSWY